MQKYKELSMAKFYETRYNEIKDFIISQWIDSSFNIKDI